MEDYKKKYEDALGRANTKIETYNHLGNASVVKSICEIFPELKESEDERIRKSIIDLVEKQMPKSENKKWMIAWLEKQGEQKPIISDDAIREGVAHFGITQYQITNWLKKYVDVKKQGEQKPSDKVEPKFKVGDWIVQEGVGTYKVVEVYKWYEVIGIDGNQYSISFLQENDCHLWTIQDAKDGDVLATKDTAFIFKHMDKTGLSLCKSYCEVIGNSELGLGFDFSINGVHPATKEQCDLLFSKMKEAGYEWDAEKKELKKIEQTYFQKQEWTGYDEKAYEIALLDIDKSPSITKNDTIDWLKGVKERLESIRPQNTTVTDEELAQAKKDAYNNALDKIEYHSGEPTFDDGWSAAIGYLKKKNTQPQNTWKPSEEQMEALRKAVDEHFDIDGDDLWHLYEDLKKLREE